MMWLLLPAASVIVVEVGVAAVVVGDFVAVSHVFVAAAIVDVDVVVVVHIASADGVVIVVALAPAVQLSSSFPPTSSMVASLT